MSLSLDTASVGEVRLTADSDDQLSPRPNTHPIRHVKQAGRGRIMYIKNRYQFSTSFHSRQTAHTVRLI